MDEQAQHGLRLFLTYWALFAALGGLNVYNYVHKGSKLSLVVAIVCGVIFVGWAVFYFVYFRRPQNPGKPPEANSQDGPRAGDPASSNY